MRINQVDRLHNLRRSVVLLITIRHVANRNRDLQISQRGFRLYDLGGQRTGAQHGIEQRLGSELEDTSDVFGFGVGVEGREEVVSAGFPLVGAVETEPDECVDAETVVPSCFDYGVTEDELNNSMGRRCKWTY